MPWSASNTVPAIQSKSLKLRELFAKVANASLDKGLSEQESIFAGINAVKIEERKNQPAKAKAKEPKKPSHVESLRSYTNPFEVVSKAEIPLEIPTVKAAEFDAEGRLVILMSDGRRVVTKGKAVEQHIDQRIGVSVNPVFDHIQMNTTANYTAEDYLPGMMTWNQTEDCLDIVQSDNSILQVGLESYIIVANAADTTLTNGTVVRFAGIGDTDSPKILPMLSTDIIEPLQLVGVLTSDIQSGAIGRATVFGKVRNINTTGSDVGESWSTGDLLWVHPSIPGKLTKIRPTAPVSAIFIGTVVRVGTTNGAILVKPAIFPHLAYGTFSSHTNQIPTNSNTAYPVTFQDTEISHGVDLINSSHIVTRYAGLFTFDFRLQVVSSNSSNKVIYIWGRKNGVDIPKSTTRISFAGNGVELAPSWSFTTSMLRDDYFELVYAVDDITASIHAPAATAFCPATPSATIRVTQINL
jgi:hypothetical protein